MPKHSSGVRGEFGGQQCQKRQKDPTKEERKCCHCPERREYRLQYVLILFSLDQQYSPLTTELQPFNSLLRSLSFILSDTPSNFLTPPLCKILHSLASFGCSLFFSFLLCPSIDLHAGFRSTYITPTLPVLILLVKGSR